MTWRLEIHHIDVTASGDSTLIIARNLPPGRAPGPAVRSVLIDGGRQGPAPDLHSYLGRQLGNNPLDVMICTHYDDDHVNGLIELLKMPGRYGNTIIYDQGWASVHEANYIRYVQAINGLDANAAPVPGLGLLNRTRVTATIQADAVPPAGGMILALGPPAVPAGGLGAIVDAPQWLITAAAAPQDPLWHGAGLAGPPAGAPTMRFIAANKYIRTPAGWITGPVGGGGADPKNEKSLAVEVRFGNFRYYVGGDIETAQENFVRTYLNNADNTAGRVLAMKASHHGANTATSRGFVDRLRPAAVFISCGTSNHLHPSEQVVNVLDGYPWSNAAHPPAPPPPPCRPVDYYLTGYRLVGPPPASFGGDMSLTAGDPVGPVRRGDIKLTVTSQMSDAPVEGKIFRAVRAATLAALTGPDLAGLPGAVLAGAPGPVPAGQIADAAAEEAMLHGGGPAAATVITQAGGPLGARVAAGGAANGAIPPGHRATSMASVVTAAALAPPPGALAAAAAVAAGAGAAAGAYYGGGDELSVELAIASAVYTASGNAGWPAAQAYGNAAARALGPAPAQFQVYLYAYYPPFGPKWVTVTQA